MDTIGQDAAVAEGFQPIETIQYWADAYAKPDGCEHFMGHGMVAKLLREYAHLRAMLGTTLSVAAQDVLSERRRQIEAEGWMPEHDDEHGSGELAQAAACYATSANQPERLKRITGPINWPWDFSWWKPGLPRRDLVKAGALILAEIERLDRAAMADSRKGVWDAHSNSGMRFPESSDLVGGATDGPDGNLLEDNHGNKN